jgi:hypothetical protein
MAGSNDLPTMPLIPDIDTIGLFIIEKNCGGAEQQKQSQQLNCSLALN